MASIRDGAFLILNTTTIAVHYFLSLSGHLMARLLTMMPDFLLFLFSSKGSFSSGFTYFIRGRLSLKI